MAGTLNVLLDMLLPNLNGKHNLLLGGTHLHGPHQSREIWFVYSYIGKLMEVITVLCGFTVEFVCNTTDGWRMDDTSFVILLLYGHTHQLSESEKVKYNVVNTACHHMLWSILQCQITRNDHLRKEPPSEKESNLITV